MFDSSAENLVNNDTNNVADVFIPDQGILNDYFAVFGRVTDSKGNGIMGATISSLTGQVTTEMEGFYVLSNLDPDTYTLTISKEGYTFSPSSLPVTIPPSTPNINFSSQNAPVNILISLVSIASDGVQGNAGSGGASISADGRFIAFSSSADNLISDDTNEWGDIFVHDRQTGQTTLVSVASDGTKEVQSSASPSISADGRFIAFESSGYLLSDNDTTAQPDIFIHDRQTSETTLVSVASDGTQAAGSSFKTDISADGRFVVFRSYADNLVDGDTNNRVDVFVHDRETGETTRVSIASDGTEMNNSAYN
ncbi:MAG: carboxypeptidase regulatory-like domain-containing protein, partial [Methylococcales bacterium]|nr:carboxypeptidase regulatory-like domain-containing protein [Methylococcales bacterium]